MILRELGDKNGFIVCLEDVAGLAASLARTAPAARLLGAAAALREELGVPATPVEHARNERALAEVRAERGEMATTKLLVSGRSLSIEQAIAEAHAVLREVATTLDTA